MIPVLVTLVQNAALLLAMMVVFDLVTSRKPVLGQWWRKALAGVILGGLCIGLMITSFRLETGIIFDTRSVLLSLSGLFLGPIPTVFSMTIAAVYRLWQGGTGVWTGIWVILATGGIGILWRHYRQGKLEDISIRELYGFGVVVHLVMLALMLTLPWEAAWRVLGGIGLPVLLVYPIATIALGWLLANRLARENATDVLAASEARYRSVFEVPNVGKSVTLPTGEIEVNRAFCDMLGYDPEELRGKTWQELTPPEEIGPVNELLAPLLRGEKDSVRFEKRYIHKNGSYVWADVSNSVQRDKDGNPLHFIVTVVDITERKRAEMVLQRQEHDLRESQRIAHVGSWRLDVATNQVVWTEELYNMYGFDPSLPPPPYTEHMKLFTPESWDRLSTALAHTRETGIPYTLELETVRKDGSSGWMWVRGEADVDSAGKTVELWGAAQDITERKRTEEALKESEELLETTGRMARVGGWQLDAETMALTWTKETYRIHEVSPDSMPTLDKAIEFFHPDDREALSQAIQRALDRGEPYDMELQFITARGNKLWTRTICRPEVVDGKTVRLQGTFQDITERKQAEVERENLQTQLNQAQKMESVGRLAGGVAHDFNNMLGVILGHTELALLRADENHDLYSDLIEIQTAAMRSADITKQLLAFARKQVISPRQLDLNDTVENMLNMLRRLIGEDIDLVWQPAAHLWPVKMDPSQIDQILANLCINARDAISGVGKLTIETGIKTFDEEYCSEHYGFIPGDFVLLAASDSGCGMDKDTLDNLFEPFFTTKEVGKGTGLGLATVYGIVKQNNGFINVYSEPGQGSTFKIYLPRIVADADTDKAVPDKKAAAGGTETILLVEDEPAILRMTRMMLERRGYTVLYAASPSEAVKKAKNHSGSIDLLMTDVVMPEMNGRDLAKQITALYPGIRLLFMSGYTANVIAHRGILDDGVAFIQKPFSMEDLAEKLRDVLDNS